MYWASSLVLARRLISCLWLDQELSWGEKAIHVIQQTWFQHHGHQVWKSPGFLIGTTTIPDICQWSLQCFICIIYIIVCRWYQCLCHQEKSIKFIYNNEYWTCQIVGMDECHKLSLNVKKPKYMLFCTKNSSVILNDIVLNCEIIEKVEHFKFLGVHIHSKLNWSYHI